MEEPEDSLFAGAGQTARVAAAAGMRLVEVRARRLQEIARRESELQREAAAALRERFEGQRLVMHAIVAPSLEENWRERATPKDIARVFAHAEAWREHDPVAEQAHRELSEYIKSRQGDVQKRISSYAGAFTGQEEVLSGSLEVERIPAEMRSPGQLRAALTNDWDAGKWANYAEVQGRQKADQWLQQNSNEEIEALVRKWEHLERSEDEQQEADKEHALARQSGTETEREEHEAKAEEHEGASHVEVELSDEAHSQAADARYERGSKDLQKRDPEAAEALRGSAPGREQPVKSQLAKVGRKTKSPTPKKSAQKRANKVNTRGR
ncbi:hypothetical protein ACUIAJ_09075 [Dermabacteraceae bacterium CCM 9519]